MVLASKKVLYLECTTHEKVSICLANMQYFSWDNNLCVYSHDIEICESKEDLSNFGNLSLTMF